VSENKDRLRLAKRELLGLSLLTWALSIIAFLSIPLIGVASFGVVGLAMWGYLKARSVERALARGGEEG